MLQKQKAHYTNKSKEIAEKSFDKFWKKKTFFKD